MAAWQIKCGGALTNAGAAVLDKSLLDFDFE